MATVHQRHGQTDTDKQTDRQTDGRLTKYALYILTDLHLKDKNCIHGKHILIK